MPQKFTLRDIIAQWIPPFPITRDKEKIASDLVADFWLGHLRAEPENSDCRLALLRRLQTMPSGRNIDFVLEPVNPNLVVIDLDRGGVRQVELLDETETRSNADRCLFQISQASWSEYTVDMQNIILDLTFSSASLRAYFILCGKVRPDFVEAVHDLNGFEKWVNERASMDFKPAPIETILEFASYEYGLAEKEATRVLAQKVPHWSNRGRPTKSERATWVLPLRR
ncbi:hypothetical protein WDZ92_35540 [Nostoc sp. NIES-2111]